MNTYKIILLGNCDVGKSSITNRYIYDTFRKDIMSTIGASYHTKMIETERGKFKLNLWDCSGNDRFATLLPMYYRDTNVALVVYDVTSLVSYNKCQKYIDNLKIHTDNVLIILVANKIDLKEREITTKDGELLANSNNIMYCECSAKLGNGVVELFDLIVSKLNIKLVQGETLRDKPIRLDDEVEKTKCCF